MIKIRFTILSLLMSSLGLAQDQQKLDSLLKVSENQEGTERYLTIQEVYLEYLYVDTKLAFPYLEQLKEIAETSGEKDLKAKYYNANGVFQFYKSDFENSLQEFQKAKKLYEELSNLERVSALDNNIGNGLRNLGKYKQSLESHMNSLRLKEEIGADLESRAASYWNIGNLHGDLFQWEESNSWYEKALKAFDSLGLESDRVNIEALLAGNYHAMGQPDRAIPYYENALAFFTKKNQYTNMADMHENLGRLYYEEQENQQAEFHFKKCIEISSAYAEKTLTAAGYHSLGRLYHRVGRHQEALQLFYQAKEIREASGQKPAIMRTYNAIADLFGDMGQYEKAFEYSKYYNDIKGRILTEETMERINELEIKYQTEKKEAALALQEEEINTLNEKAKVDKLTKSLYAGGMGSFIVISGLLFFGFRQRIKKNRIAREKQEELYKREIDHKKKELASQTLHLVQKNTFLEELQENLQALRQSPEKFKMEFRRIAMLLKKEKASDRDWETFKTYFSEVHNDFDQKLKTLSDSISEKEIRLAAFLRMSLTTKEIAATMNVLPESVLKSKYRLKKKLGLDKETELNEFLASL